METSTGYLWCAVKSADASTSHRVVAGALVGLGYLSSSVARLRAALLLYGLAVHPVFRRADVIRSDKLSRRD